MKLGAMLSDIIESAFTPPITEQYPFVKNEAPERFRGKIVWDQESCTGCGLCAKDCPANAIEVLVYDRKEKRFVFNYNLDTCLFCAQCVYSCRSNSIAMSNDDWELAAMGRTGYHFNWGNEEDVERYRAGERPEPKKKPAAKAKK